MKSKFRIFGSMVSLFVVVMFTTYVIATILFGAIPGNVIALSNNYGNVDFYGEVIGATNSNEITSTFSANTIADFNGNDFSWDIGDIKMDSSGTVPIKICITLTNVGEDVVKFKFTPPAPNSNLTNTNTIGENGDLIVPREEYSINKNEMFEICVSFIVKDVRNDIYKANVSFEIDLYS